MGTSQKIIFQLTMRVSAENVARMGSSKQRKAWMMSAMDIDKWVVEDFWSVRAWKLDLAWGKRFRSGFSSLPDSQSDVGSFRDVTEQAVWSISIPPLRLLFQRPHVSLDFIPKVFKISRSLIKFPAFWFDRVDLASFLINMASEVLSLQTKSNYVHHGVSPPLLLNHQALFLWNG